MIWTSTLPAGAWAFGARAGAAGTGRRGGASRDWANVAGEQMAQRARHALKNRTERRVLTGSLLRPA